MCKNVRLFNFIAHKILTNVFLSIISNLLYYCNNFKLNLFVLTFQIGIFDLDKDDPLKLSNIVGEAVVSFWSTEDLKTDGEKIKHQLIYYQF